MPSLSRHPRRDPHGRGPRGPLFFPGTPAWKTRRENFDALATSLIVDLAKKWPAVYTIEFATEDVPPSDPAPWEDHSEVLGRVFHADRRRGLKDRIVVYRLPIVLRSHDDVPRTLRKVLVERISRVLAIPPDELEEELR
ncbi:metallopeptidase family protein [Schaalia cardiffensis]|uniref:metallopeptidase family protein n=1 Tax=Schaalia cardiffensis TaxID=181487 RepID=UPI0018E6F0DC|nr:metallopeptidase family protein [Schaalia cardiffensis]MBJ2328575.1 metallopeptidase family protein [Schaalia cardiffensis]